MSQRFESKQDNQDSKSSEEKTIAAFEAFWTRKLEDVLSAFLDCPLELRPLVESHLFVRNQVDLEKDKKIAMEWLTRMKEEKAREQEKFPSRKETLLGILYAWNEQYKEASECFERAQKDDPEAQFQLGCLLCRESTPESIKQAMVLFQQAKNNNNSNATLTLSLLYSERQFPWIYPGINILDANALDKERSLIYLTQAAMQKHPIALKRLGDVWKEKKLDEEAISCYRNAATYGNPQGLIELANGYISRKVLTQNIAVASKLYDVAAKIKPNKRTTSLILGNPIIDLEPLRTFWSKPISEFFSEGVTRDYSTLINLIDRIRNLETKQDKDFLNQKFAELESQKDNADFSDEKRFLLALLYDEYKKDIQQAIHHYDSLAKQKGPLANLGMDGLGWVFENFYGDPKKALTYFKALDQNSPAYCLAFGWIYKSNKYNELGFPYNLTNSLACYQKADVPQAHFYMGKILFDHNKQFGGSEAYEKAFKHFQVDLEHGHCHGGVSTLLHLAYQYYRGWGVTENSFQAFRLYQEAAKYDKGEAYFFLGSMYKNGFAVTKDIKEAFRFFEVAAKHDYYQSFSELGFLYETGQGTAPNPGKAAEYYLKALNKDREYKWDTKASEDKLIVLFHKNQKHPVVLFHAAVGFASYLADSKHSVSLSEDKQLNLSIINTAFVELAKQDPRLVSQLMIKYGTSTSLIQSILGNSADKVMEHLTTELAGVQAILQSKLPVPAVVLGNVLMTLVAGPTALKSKVLGKAQEITDEKTQRKMIEALIVQVRNNDFSLDQEGLTADVKLFQLLTQCKTATTLKMIERFRSEMKEQESSNSKVLLGLYCFALKDYSKAMDYFSASLDPRGFYLSGKIYETGVGNIEPSFLQAERFYNKAMECNHPLAKSSLEKLRTQASFGTRITSKLWNAVVPNLESGSLPDKKNPKP